MTSSDVMDCVASEDSCTTQIPFPNKKYKIIYADPAWQYEDKSSAGKRGACFKYPVMDIEAIKNLQISQIADEDCVLFLWVTFPKLNEVFEVIRAWGFEYKTCALTWVKINKKANTYFMGMGRWTRANSEICLLATKGNPQMVSSNRKVLLSRIREHSRKPDEVRERIVKLCGDLPRVELFARQRAEGWDSWGNEVPK